jgi:hypothetical protein
MDGGRWNRCRPFYDTTLEAIRESILDFGLALPEVAAVWRSLLFANEVSGVV